MFDGFGIEPPQMSCLSRPIKGQLLPAKLPLGGNMHLRREIHSFRSSALHFSAPFSLWNADCWVMIKRRENRQMPWCYFEMYWRKQLGGLATKHWNITEILLFIVLVFIDVLLSNKIQLRHSSTNTCSQLPKVRAFYTQQEILYLGCNWILQSFKI